MWNNINKHKYTSDIDLNNFIDANKIVKDKIIETPLIKLEGLSQEINKPVYIKDESVQKTNSFKIRGIYNNVYNILNNIKEDNINIITQSTGNHGVAVLFSIYEYLKNEKYDKVVKSINPIIFASSSIQKLKLNKMIYYLDKIRDLLGDKNRGMISYHYDSYEIAVNSRLEFMKNNKSIYVAHGSMDIIIGHGTMGLEIKNQLDELGYNKDTKITFLAACGAGGPIGIGICLKELYDNVNFAIVQTDDQAALIESLKQDKIVKNIPNNPNIPFNFADGIAVDNPEKDAYELCKNYADAGIAVNHNKCFYEAKNLNNDMNKSTNKTDIFCGGTTVAVYLAIKELKNSEIIQNSDIVIMLGCEGNIDNEIIDYINHL